MSLVFGLLLESVTTNLSDIGRARLEARAALLAEQRARELELEINGGTAVELGVTEGEYEEPDQDLRWQTTVSEHALDLPADYPGEASPSPLFTRPGAPAAPGQVPPLRMIEVRVFPSEAEPESADPFVVLVTTPADTSALQQTQETPPQAPGQGGTPEQDAPR